MRSLGRDNVGAIDGGPDQFALEPLQRLGYAQDRNGGAVPGGRLGDCSNQGRADQRPSGVVDEDHGIERLRRAGPGPRLGLRRGGFGQSRYSGRDRLLAPLPARDHGHDRVRQPGRGGDLRDAGRGGDDDDPRDPGRGQRLDRPAQHGPPGQIRRQLVPTAHAPAGPGRDNDRLDRDPRACVRRLGSGTHSSWA